MTLEMTYFRAEFVQLIVSRSDSELKVQRYGMKKNTLTVDPVMLQGELWMWQREKPSPNRRCRFFENQTAETEFSVFEFWGWFGLVFRKPISEIFIGFRTPLILYVCGNVLWDVSCVWSFIRWTTFCMVLLDTDLLFLCKEHILTWSFKVLVDLCSALLWNVVIVTFYSSMWQWDFQGGHKVGEKNSLSFPGFFQSHKLTSP